MRSTLLLQQKLVQAAKADLWHPLIACYQVCVLPRPSAVSLLQRLRLIKRKSTDELSSVVAHLICILLFSLAAPPPNKQQEQKEKKQEN